MGKSTERQPAITELLDSTVSPSENRRIMAGVRKGQHPVLGIENRIYRCHIISPFQRFVKQIIYLHQDGPDGEIIPDFGFQAGPESRHDKRCRYPLPGNVADGPTEGILLYLYEIIIIAADVGR